MRMRNVAVLPIAVAMALSLAACVGAPQTEPTEEPTQTSTPTPEPTETSSDRVFSMLMGDKVEPRREFIEKYARDVENLDV